MLHLLRTDRILKAFQRRWVALSGAAPSGANIWGSMMRGGWGLASLGRLLGELLADGPILLSKSIGISCALSGVAPSGALGAKSSLWPSQIPPSDSESCQPREESKLPSSKTGNMLWTGFHPVWITVWHFYVGLVLKQGSTNFLHTFRAGRASFFSSTNFLRTFRAGRASFFSKPLFAVFFLWRRTISYKKKIHRPLFFSCASVSR